MAKLSKKVFKGLIKECLIEILSEGFGQSIQNELRTSPTRKSKGRAHTNADIESLRSRRDESLDRTRINENFNENVQNNVSALTEDPIMASIFADTAQSTLQEQMAAESIPGQPQSTFPMSHHGNNDSVDEQHGIFEESEKNWALLAFSDKNSK